MPTYLSSFAVDPEDMLEEIRKEAMRQDRTLSWMAQKAWRLARAEIKKLPRAT